jgi:hypothetical protein
MTTYNGHKNWDYWNVSLWINNDKVIYNLALQAMKCHKTATEAAEWFLNAVGETNTPDGARYTMPNVREAIKDILS